MKGTSLLLADEFGRLDINVVVATHAVILALKHNVLFSGLKWNPIVCISVEEVVLLLNELIRNALIACNQIITTL